MTTEQLLIPRYKVINDWPGSPCTIGEILPSSDLETVYNRYPHLFRPLQWWEERRISDLPNYIRITGDVYKVDEWLNNAGNHPRSVENPNLAIEWHFIAGHSIPTTLEEYLTYINSKK